MPSLLDLNKGAVYHHSDLERLQGTGPKNCHLSFCFTVLLVNSPGPSHCPKACWKEDGFYHVHFDALAQRQEWPTKTLTASTLERPIAIFTDLGSKRCRFLGFFLYIDHDHSGQQATYRLVEDETPTHLWRPMLEVRETTARDISLYRRHALTASDKSPTSVADYAQARRRMAVYALARASGFCELCGTPAPFSAGGSPYLETHCLGPNHRESSGPLGVVAALCPSCHQRMLLGDDRKPLSSHLLKKLLLLEQAMEDGRLKRVVAVILTDASHRIYVAQRASGPLKGHWEFPGGKVEPNEPLVKALHRELKEELNVTLDRVTPFLAVDYQYPSFFLRLFSFAAITTQCPHLLEHQAAHWAAVHELNQYRWVPADDPIVSRLAAGPFPQPFACPLLAP